MKTVNETRTFIVKLPRHCELNALGKLLNSRAEVALSDTYIWIRLLGDEEHMASVAACIQGSHFRMLENKLLVPLGCAVATERLPELAWSRLTSVLHFKLPIAGLPGRLVAGELPELRLFRGGAERPALAGLYALDALYSWVVSVPRFRLHQLAACVSEDVALVIGSPLPPLACEFLCQDGRLLTPAGMTWYPRIPAEQVLELFDVAEDQLLLWTQTDHWSSIPIEIIKPLRRASLRAFVEKY